MTALTPSENTDATVGNNGDEVDSAPEIAPSSILQLVHPDR
jgi:hypothetical protein